MRVLMSSKYFIYVVAYLSVPLLILSLGDAIISLKRVYLSSNGFMLAIMLGALVTSIFYARFISKRSLRNSIILFFGLVIPYLYVHASRRIFSSGEQEYHELWSPIYTLTTLIGIIEIVLYAGIFVLSFYLILRAFFKKIAEFLTPLAFEVL